MSHTGCIAHCTGSVLSLTQDSGSYLLPQFTSATIRLKYFLASVPCSQECFIAILQARYAL